MRLPRWLKRPWNLLRTRPAVQRIVLLVARSQYRWGSSNGVLNSSIGAIKRVGLSEPGHRVATVGALVETFFDIVESGNVDLFVEAGAKEATASRRAATLEGVDVVAFEANPFTYRRFAAELEGTPVRYEHLALNDQQTIVTFHVRQDELGEPIADGRGSLLVQPDHEPGYIQARVDAVTLDAYFAAPTFSSSARIAMWVDVEGALSQVLGGAVEVLGRTDVMLVEVETRVTWENQQMLGADVNQYLAKFDLHPVAADIQTRYQHNVLYVRSSLLGNQNVADRLTRFRYRGE